MSSPQKTYETCYSTIDVNSPSAKVKIAAGTCLTQTAQRAIISYAVLGGSFIGGMKDIKGRIKYPAFSKAIEGVIKKHGLKHAARDDFKKADLATIIADLAAVYARNPSVLDHLQYSNRNLENVTVSENTAEGAEVFSLKYPFPANKLVLNFIKVDNHWLINHISHM